jgi:hypothetical protein
MEAAGTATVLALALPPSGNNPEQVAAL